MVVKLNKPNINSASFISKVVDERRGGANYSFFCSIKNEWVSKVEEYERYGGSPEYIEKWSQADGKKISFLNLYKSPAEGSVQGIEIDNLRSHGLNLCPACGESGTPNTLDHYLPKGLYPHFSVLPQNLFPMCDACQLSKGEKTNDFVDPKFFIHPYFDSFSKPKLIRLSIDGDFNAPTFTLSPNPELMVAEINLVTCHLRELDIKRRYSVFFKNEYMRLLKLIGKMRASQQDILLNLQNFKYLHEIASSNSWECIFYEAVIDNALLINFLKNGVLPSFS